MTTALSPGRCLVGISSPEVDRGEKWVGRVVVKGLQMTCLGTGFCSTTPSLCDLG